MSGETPNQTPSDGQSGVASQAPQPYSEGVQGIDYAYTIRGWLRGINANSLAGIDDLYDQWDGMSGEDKWGMSIGYTEPSCNIEATDGGQVRYDGSPSWMMWARINSSPLNGLKMTYDTADRLLKATGVAYQSGCNWLIDNKFSETFSYDRVGNMTGLQRRNGATTLIDNLTFGYKSNKNQLDYISDASNQSAGVQNGQSANNYGFDGNGNQNRDDQQQISSTLYDWRNLPVQINYCNGDYIKYRYNADGVRIYKYVYRSGAACESDPVEAGTTGGEEARPSAIRWDYEVDVKGETVAVYENANLTIPKYYRTGVGSLATADNKRYYEINDQLGNVRCVVDGSATVVSWSDYYAYGAVRESGGVTSSYDNRHQYLGAEADRETNTLHLQAREFDLFGGRFWQTDPKASAFPSLSPYLYGNANPYLFRDPTGLAAEGGDEEKEKERKKKEQEARMTPTPAPTPPPQIVPGVLSLLSTAGRAITAAGLFIAIILSPTDAVAPEMPKNIILYHGSLDDYSKIMENGLSGNKLPAYVTEDKEAAVNAIGEQRVVKPNEGKDRGIIESEVSRGEYNSLIKVGDIERRVFPGFNTPGQSYQESKLKTPKAVDFFNKGIKRK